MRHPVSYLFYISSLGRRVLASADTRPDSRYWCGMTTDIIAQQPGTAALLTGEMFTTNKQFNTAERCSKYSFQIVAVDVLPDDDEFTKWACDPAQPRPPCAAADDQ